MKQVSNISLGHFQFERQGTAINFYNATSVPDSNCTFAFMGWRGYPCFMFGSNEPGATCNTSGMQGMYDYDTPFSVDDEANITVTREDLVTFLNNCHEYMVDYKHDLTQAQFETLISGVRAWANATNFIYYYGNVDFSVNFFSGDTNLEVTSFGTQKLVDNGDYAQASGGLVSSNISKNVDNYFIDAYMYDPQALNPVNYTDDALEFITFDSIKKAIEEEFITDPDIIDFMEDIEWDVIEETRCDWTVNVDGVKNPDLAITWNAPGIQSGDFDSGSAVVNMEVYNYGYGAGTGQWMNYGTFAYDKKVIKTTWAKMAEFAEVPDFHKILNNVFSIDAKVRLRFHLTYFFEGMQYETSRALAIISYQASTEGKIEPPRDGSTITFTHSSTDEFIEEFVDDIDVPDTPDGTSASSKQQTYSGIGVMTRTYVMSVARLQQLGRFLWSYDFYDFIQDLNASPIENIVSIKMLPFTIPGGTDEEIVLGNVGTGVLGKPVDIDYNCKQVINSGGTTIAKKYGANENFLNSKPFTKLSVFLPYIGFKELDPDIFLDKALKVEYISDIITGSCVAVIYADDVPICQYSGLIGLDVPISATNRAQVEAGIISGVGQTIMGLSSGSLGAGAMGAMSILGNSYHTETRGTASPSCDSFVTHDVFYILENAEVQYPSRYNHLHGRPLNLSKTLRNVSGFTVCENVDTSGIQGATREEMEQIKDFLEKGVYL